MVLCVEDWCWLSVCVYMGLYDDMLIDVEVFGSYVFNWQVMFVDGFEVVDCNDIVEVVLCLG